MNQESQDDQQIDDSVERAPAVKRGINWNDPTVPIGNAPPLAKWPIGLWALAWAGWIVFLFVTLSNTQG